MHRKFIATIVTAALVVTTLGTAPARANDNFLGALAAVAGIAIVGKVIHDHNTRKHTHHTVSRQTYKAPAPHRKAKVYTPKPRPLPKRVNRKLLPGSCLHGAHTRHGRVQYFGARCLQRSYQHVGALPHACGIRVQGVGRGYDAHCLRSRGYQLARH